MQIVTESVLYMHNAIIIMLITTSAILGLVILSLIMQAINYVRVSRQEREIKELINDLRLRK